MAFDWKEFLTLAEHLMEEKDARVSRECFRRATDAIAYARSLIEDSIQW